MNQRHFILGLVSTGVVSISFLAGAAPPPLIGAIDKEIIRKNRDGSEGTTWFHPRSCVIPNGKNGKPFVLMCLQSIGGSDFFGPVHWSSSDDSGKTWSDPEAIEALGRMLVPGKEGLKAGVCDVVPEYHPKTNTTLAMGHVVFYKGTSFSKKEQLSRYPVYTVRKADGTWSERKILEWDDPRGAHIYSNNCGQRVTLPDGDIIMSFTFGPKPNGRMVCGVRCSFDGETLKIKEVGPPIKHPVKRGLLEPSVTQFGGRFYMTIRAEDGHGYVCVSDDGLHYSEKKAWSWKDGGPLTMSTTQQHWLTHKDGLFLVYTREDELNSKVTRWRSPLWVARVDPETLSLDPDTERTVLPLIGDGVNEPDKVAIMGNFHVTRINAKESWVTVGEWMPRSPKSGGDLLLARIKWARPDVR